VGLTTIFAPDTLPASLLASTIVENRQRSGELFERGIPRVLSRVAEGTGPVKPQQPADSFGVRC
jgi:hypothetical protein